MDSNILGDGESTDGKEDMGLDDRGCVRIPEVDTACTKGFAGRAAASVTRLRGFLKKILHTPILHTPPYIRALVTQKPRWSRGSRLPPDHLNYFQEVTYFAHA